MSRSVRVMILRSCNEMRTPGDASKSYKIDEANDSVVPRTGCPLVCRRRLHSSGLVIRPLDSRTVKRSEQQVNRPCGRRFVYMSQDCENIAQ